MHLHSSLLIFHSQGVLCSNPCYYLCVPKAMCLSIYSDNSIQNDLVCCRNIISQNVHKINESKTAVWHHDFWAPSLTGLRFWDLNGSSERKDYEECRSETRKQQQQPSANMSFSCKVLKLAIRKEWIACGCTLKPQMPTISNIKPMEILILTIIVFILLCIFCVLGSYVLLGWKPKHQLST
jgi:hypothetical protein